MKPQLLLFVILVLIAVSCKKDKTADPTPPTPVVNPQGELLGPQPSFKLVRMSVRDSTRVYSATRFRYDNRSRIVSANDDLSGVQHFLINYDGDTMKYFTTYDRAGEAIMRTEYPLKISESGNKYEMTLMWPADNTEIDTTINTILFSNGRVHQIISSSRNFNVVYNSSRVSTFAYNDNGNLISVPFYNDGNLLGTYIAHSHDSQKNLFKDVSRLVFLVSDYIGLISTSTNNVLSETDQLGNNYQYEYTYDNNGYPLTKRQVGAEFWTQYEYEY